MKPRLIEVDFAAVWDALDERRRDEGLSWRELAAMLETQDFQISDMKWRGKGVSAHTLLAMMFWLDRDLRDFKK